MPEYKKKKVHRRSLEGKTPSKHVTVKPAAAKKSKKAELHVLKSDNTVKKKKLQQSRFKRKTKIVFFVAAVLAVAIFVLAILSPVSLSESMSNFFNTIGSGGYPLESVGGQVIDCCSFGNHYYLLTDSSLKAYSASGKEIISIPHGFSNPMMVANESRALVFDQGGNSLIVANLSGVTNPYSSEHSILTATLARNGTYAVAAKSDSYTSSVTVFSRKDKKIYEWNCAKDYINNIALSKNGKKIAFTTVNAVNAQISSKLYVFETDKTNSVYSKDLDTAAPLMLRSNKSGFSLVTSVGYSFTDWSNYKTTDVSNDYTPAFFRQSSNRILQVFNRTSNTTDNLIVVLSDKGQKLGEFKFSGAISDIQIRGNHIYCISETNAYLFDKTGKLLKTGICSFGCERISVLGSRTVGIISDNGIEKFEIDNEVEK